MTPPPADPIRPVGPVAGDVFVARAELPERVHRRQRHEEDGGERRGGQHHAQQDQGSQQPWEGELPVDPGTYDDHGRTQHHDGEDPPVTRHIDATA